MFAFWEDIKERIGIDKVHFLSNLREVVDLGHYKVI